MNGAPPVPAAPLAVTNVSPVTRGVAMLGRTREREDTGRAVPRGASLVLPSRGPPWRLASLPFTSPRTYTQDRTVTRGSRAPVAQHGVGRRLPARASHAPSTPTSRAPHRRAARRTWDTHQELQGGRTWDRRMSEGWWCVSPASWCHSFVHPHHFAKRCTRLVTAIRPGNVHPEHRAVRNRVREVAVKVSQHDCANGWRI